MHAQKNICKAGSEGAFMDEIMNYDKDVEIIKTAILQSQYDAARSVNEKQLMLYYGIGKYISLNSRKGFWGKGAIDAISERLDKELPGLRGGYLTQPAVYADFL